MSIRSYSLRLGGGACTAAALLLSLVIPDALNGWLVGFAFWSSLPIGALVLVMMIRLIPGRWSRVLTAPAEAASLVLPLALLASLPLLIGTGALYPWSGQAEEGFRGAYLVPWSFALRTIGFFALTIALALALLLRPRWSTPLAAGGLILFVPFDTVIAFDWLMSLDPEFHSSGFGLYVLSIQVTIALCLLILVHLTTEPEDCAPPAGVLLSSLLLWAYFAFMQFFIIWSADLPQGVVWYQHRSGGAWTAVIWIVAALHLVPTFLLLFAPFRRGRAWLISVCIAVLLGKALEVCWLVLPDTSASLAAVVVTLLSLGGLGAVTAAIFPEALRRRRTPALARERKAVS